MGRTIRPVRYEIEAQLDELRRYLVSLRQEDREHFEAVVSDIKSHISSISYSNPLNPNELMQWCALLGMQKRIAKLKNEIDRHIQDRQ